MNIPNLPTDHLYKFVALSGLVILLATAYFPTTTARELKLAMIRIQGQTCLLKLETQHLEDQVNLLASNSLLNNTQKRDVVEKAYSIKLMEWGTSITK